MTEYFEDTEWLRKLKFWEVTYSPTEFSFLWSFTERRLIAWVRMNSYTKTFTFREEYDRSKMITSGKIEQSVECCFF